MARPPRTPRTPRPPRYARPSRPPRNRSAKRPAGLPTPQADPRLHRLVRPAGGQARDRAGVRAVRATTRSTLKRLLKDMADEGLIDSSPGRAFHQAGGVPKVTVLRVSRSTTAAHVWAVPEQWHAETPPPRLRVIERGKRSALGIGDRVLCRTEEQGRGLRRPPDEEARALGRAGAGRGQAGGRALLAVAGRQEASGASCRSAT